jgi:Zn finger protein HypA/HybF involved in hydrogenase expression
MRTPFNEQNFRTLVTSSRSKREVLQKMGLKANGGNYLIFKQRIRRLNVDISHFEPTWAAMQKKRGKVQPKSLDKLLVEHSTHNRYHLRERIIKNKLIDYECQICGLTSWLNQPISLQLDHINGINDDNRIENLRFLCPNCHSQTDTYGSKRGFGADRLLL